MRRIVEEVGASQSLIQFVPDRPGHDRRYAIDFAVAQQELGWEPRLTFEDGLRATVRWYRENKLEVPARLKKDKAEHH